MKKSQVRIIAGKWRGRKIHFTPIEGLRPTSDRVRETLFNWLMPYITASDCLDAFAGSGALGFEALSRGANSVTFLESSRTVCNDIKTNILQMAATQAHCLEVNALSFMQNSDQSFDIVFLDPPFAKDYLYQCTANIEQYNIIKPEGLIYIESGNPIDHAALPSNWEMLRNKKAGHVYYALLQRLQKIE